MLNSASVAVQTSKTPPTPTHLLTERSSYLFVTRHLSTSNLQLLKDSKDYENLQKEYDSLKEENQFLNCEITSAGAQIRELEKALQMVCMADNNKTTDHRLFVKRA